MNEKLNLSVLPLRDTVLFPGVVVPVSVGRPGSLRAIEAALEGDRMIFAVAQRDPKAEVEDTDLYVMGVVARITQVQRGLGGIQLLLEGLNRGSAIGYTSTGPGGLERRVESGPYGRREGKGSDRRQSVGYLRATVMPVEEEHEKYSGAAYIALETRTRERAAELGRRRGLPEDVISGALEQASGGGRLADMVGAYTDLGFKEKQEILETLSVEARLRRVLVEVERQIQLLEAQQDLKQKVQEELGGRQREMYLREQLRTIQRQLGDEQLDEIEGTRARLQALPLGAEARSEVDKELGRLERAGQESMDAQVIRNYLEWIIELPWGARTDDRLDLAMAAQHLDADHYGLQDVKERILEFLAVRQLKAGAEEKALGKGGAEDTKEEKDKGLGETDGTPEGLDIVQEKLEVKARAIARGPILLFTGPPGVGKTSIARSIAKALGREYVRISLGGARDEADIRGHRRTYVGAMPGRILQGMKHAKTKNPVFLLDELDKLGNGQHGDPAAALLEVLDPAQNESFTDHYLGIPFDLSEVLFIATANFTEQISGPLLDRMEIVEFSGYTEQEKAHIAREYLWPKALLESGLAGKVTVSDEALERIAREYTREAGVRQLTRGLENVVRKLARKAAGGEAMGQVIDAAMVRELLGRPKVHPEVMLKEDTVGVATGMYYTAMGGRHYVR